MKITTLLIILLISSQSLAMESQKKESAFETKNRIEGNIRSLTQMQQDRSSLFNQLPRDLTPQILGFLTFGELQTNHKLLVSIIICNDLPFIPQLVAQKVNLNTQYPYDCIPNLPGHWTALTSATSLGHTQQVIELLKTPEIDIDGEGELCKLTDPFDEDKDLEDNRHTILEFGIRIRLFPLTKKTVASCTALHHATAKGNIDIVRALLQAGANVDARDLKDRTPVYYASCTGNMEILNLLIKHSARYCLRTGNVSPMHVAAATASKNNHDIINRFLELELSPNKTDSKKRTPLFIAAEYGSLNAIDALLSGGADINTVTDTRINTMTEIDKITPLKIACWNGHKEVVKKLLQHPTINISTNEGALHDAILGNQPQIVSLLLQDTRFNPNFMRENMTPLICAVRYGLHTDPEIIAFLLSDRRTNIKTKYQGKTAKEIAQMISDANKRDKILAAFKRYDRPEDGCLIQ